MLDVRLGAFAIYEQDKALKSTPRNWFNEKGLLKNDLQEVGVENDALFFFDLSECEGDTMCLTSIQMVCM